jgi:galactokinase
MMGGGFGGVAVALVDRTEAEQFTGAVAESYTDITGLSAHVYLAEAVDGVIVVAATDS